jgi:formylglycine-generating enzyme required for sulfatase activity
VQLKSLAEPGTVYVSGEVHEQIRNELACGYRWLGDANLENVRHAVRVGTAAGVVGGVAMRAGGVTQGEVPSAVKTAQPAPPASQQQAAAEVLPPELPPIVEPPAQAQASSQVAVALVKPPRLPLHAASPYEVFRECEQCPEMINLPGGTFVMGSNDDPTEKPPRQVNVAAFALGRLPVTVGEWKQCVAAKACSYEPNGDDDMPVHNVSWNDAQQYVTWLSTITNSRYRLPTEAEWEYAARAKTTPGSGPRFSFGEDERAICANANALDQTAKAKLTGSTTWEFVGCQDGYAYTAPVGRFAANGFGLHDMHGNVKEWTLDCYREGQGYRGAPTDGTAWTTADCPSRVLRGGSWLSYPRLLRAAFRYKGGENDRTSDVGLRVARSLTAP